MKKAIILITTLTILILSFDKVSAASNTGSIWAENWTDGDNWSINSQLGYMYTQRGLSTYTNYLKTITISNNSFYVENHGNIYISGYLDGLYLANQELYCSETSDDSQGSNICTTWNTEDLDLSFQIWIDNYTDQCTIDWNIPPLSQQSASHTIYFKATCQTHRTEFNKINYQIYVKDSHENSIIYQLGFNRYIKYDIPTNQTTVDAINSQTQQQQQQHDQFMNNNQTYEDKQDTNIRGVNETIEFEQAENDLLESLDTNTSIIDSIVINPQASVFIWNIMEVLRNMNPAIILLMGSMLGFGIIKLVLNR